MKNVNKKSTHATPSRASKKTTTDLPVTEESEPKSEKNTRLSLRNKNQTAPVVTPVARRSIVSTKVAGVVQHSQSSNSSTTSLAETKPANEYGSPMLISPSNTSMLPKTSSIDSGLVSIIKSEPVQISATSTISLNEDHTCDSVGNTTGSSNSSTLKLEDEKAYKAWKKSIMMALNNIAAHK